MTRPLPVILGITFAMFFKAVLAQDVELVVSVAIKAPETVSIDRFKNIYVSDKKGNIFKFEPKGKLSVEYSPVKPGKITLLEAWQGVKIFAFYQDFQQAVFFDRFLTPAPPIKLDDFSAGFVRIATISNDNNIWYIDDSSFSLVKYNFSQQRNTIHTPLNLELSYDNLDINFMREYQNYLFINDKNNGILMFDILGNYLKRLPFKGITYFNFLKDEFYYIEGNELIFVNFYNLNKRSILIPGDAKKFKSAIASENRIYLITEKSLEILSY